MVAVTSREYLNDRCCKRVLSLAGLAIWHYDSLDGNEKNEIQIMEENASFLLGSFVINSATVHVIVYFWIAFHFDSIERIEMCQFGYGCRISTYTGDVSISVGVERTVRRAAGASRLDGRRLVTWRQCDHFKIAESAKHWQKKNCANLPTWFLNCISFAQTVIALWFLTSESPRSIDIRQKYQLKSNIFD